MKEHAFLSVMYSSAFLLSATTSAASTVTSNANLENIGDFISKMSIDLLLLVAIKWLLEKDKEKEQRYMRENADKDKRIEELQQRIISYAEKVH